MNAELDLLVRLGDYDRPQGVAERAVQAEELGFDRITVGETTGWNIVPPLTLAADQTDELGISNDVISPYGRTPSMLAQTALTMQAAADGRFRFGIGPSSPAITERWHGQEFDRPLRRTREVIEIMRNVYEEGNPAYEGDIFEIAGLGYERGPSENPPPIDVGTLGPKATEMAGRFGDGWAPQMFTKDGLRDRLEDLERGAELGGKDLSDLRVAPIVRGIASEDREAAREKARGTIAFMLGAYGPYYGNSVAEQGYPDVVEAVRAAWDDRDTDAMAAALPDEVLDELAFAGTPDEVREWLAEYAAIEGVDAVRIGFVDGMSEDDKRTTMEAVADLV
ncbi:TIGR04024 family LLM class F420-dependent oxidoreductase [Natrinema thermotolerans]|uniref:TIGR04024 family LLM class F420-dependent oxidoreductase n=1 Tax=Natrinema thermotolerans TaxID=121872 RepID=A0AAF0PAM3_9EURY|nr:TIGR04024 family LLM class F420-dependent oxidoreductase [Natrinema thermotolerans]QCC60528.1 TIGR04024 family LLM class F420-dependent oxidoreductase [Natrinema thermotolerans]QCC61424.1 TIGR04024 family LLM class F420-dependent oxidoreductase [Natrinema thermotolerans]WMT07566.1 TIGR04024 family LLM class F420-dependent oxidoreductase [Natrinema thermotolerans]WMT08198.1 TIGR04024 family LLM class F420-dependent oxidoreductase [Natrinema thermotolerans]